MKSFLVIVFGLSMSGSALALDVAAMNKQIDQTNFMVNANCSATLIDDGNGLLLTANHCIQDQFTIVEREKFDENGKMTKEKIRIASPGTVSQLFFKGFNEVQRNVYGFKILKSDLKKDLALIQVQAKLTNSVDSKIACVSPQRFDTVYAVGNSLGVLYATVSNGIISSVNRNAFMFGDSENAEQGFVQSTTPVAGGNSGGALYNENRELVGVVVRGYQSVAPITFSVPLDDIKTFLSDSAAKDKVACK